MAKKKILTESQLKQYVEAYDTNRIDKKLTSVSSKFKKVTKALVENTKQMLLNESNTFVGSSNIADYTTVLIPLVLEMVPNLYAMDLVGVQPMSTAKGVAFAGRYNAGGNSGDTLASGIDNKVLPTNSFLASLDTDAQGATDPLVNNEYTLVSTGDASGVKVIPVHLQGTKSLFKITDFNGQTLEKILADIALSTTTVTLVQGGTTYTILVGYENNSMIKFFFTNYTGPMETSYAENNTIKRSTMDFHMEEAVFIADTRELSFEFTIYALEDAMSSHGFDLQADSVMRASYQLAREIDGEIVEAIERAGLRNTLREFDFDKLTTHTNEVSKVATMLLAINELAMEITKDLPNARANYLVVGQSVLPLLETLPTWRSNPSLNGNGNGFVGTIGNYKVYLDTFVLNVNRIIIGHLGRSSTESGIIFAPYRPISVRVGQGEVDFRTKSLFNSRYKVVENLMGAEKYYRVMDILNISKFLSEPASQ